MSDHIYPRHILVGDYLRAAVGALLCGTPLVMMEPHLYATPVLGLLTIVFVAYGARTVNRQRTLVTTDERGLVSSGLSRRAVEWAAIDGVRLAFFATRRRRREGVMELTVESGGMRIKLDSNISGFAEIAGRVYQAVDDNNLTLPSSTIANFQALGVTRENGWGRPADWTA